MLSHVALFAIPMDYSLPGFSVHGISQARILEWVAISFLSGCSWPMDQKLHPALAGGFFISEPSGNPRKNMDTNKDFLFDQTWCMF